MSSTSNDDEDKVLFIHQTAMFDRSLEELRRKGGIASLMAKKADEVIRLITRTEGQGVRKQFRVTRNGEYRIKYCKKYDLGCGYRLVVLRRGHHLVLLYAGSHDDCSRWIERNKGLNYEIDDTTHAIQIICDAPPQGDAVPIDVLEEERILAEYDADLMSRTDDNMLRKIFSGLVKQKHRGG
jgi:hypothetical protein